MKTAKSIFKLILRVLLLILCVVLMFVIGLICGGFVGVYAMLEDVDWKEIFKIKDNG